MADRTPAPLPMWAAIYRSYRTNSGHWTREQIVMSAIRRTRREAREAYLEFWDKAYQAKALKNVRFGRVAVSDATTDMQRWAGMTDDQILADLKGSKR